MKAQLSIELDYQQLFDKLLDCGDIEIPISDCDLQFFIEDRLEKLNISHRKIIPPRKKKAAPEKVMIIKLNG